MTVRLVEVKERGLKRLTLEEIYVNPEQVVCVRSNDETYSEDYLPEGLDKRQQFSKIHLALGAGLEITVVGSPAMVEQKLNLTKRSLLKG
jgi:hypothetical protein